MEWWGIEWKWEDMCGPGGLQPWDETSKDLGLCFQELFLQVPLSFLIAVVSGYYVGYRKDWVIREKTQERAVVLRSFVALALVITPIIQLYVLITSLDFSLYPIDYFVAGAACLSWLVHFGYVLALKHRLGPSCRGPTLILVLWSMSVALNIVFLRSIIKNGAPMGFSIATLCCHVLYLMSLIPSTGSRPTYYSQCLVGSQHRHNEYTPLLPHVDEDVLGTAMQGTSWLSKLTFGWVEPLFRKGLENKLNDPEELFDLPTKIRCGYVGAKLDKALIGNVDRFQHYEEVPHEPFIRSSSYGAIGESPTSTPVTPTARVLVQPRRRQNVSLFRALHACFAVQFYSIGLLKLVSDMAGFAGPLLLNRLITFIQDESVDVHLGYIYGASLITAAFVSAIFTAHFNWLMSVIGIKMQGAIIYTILNKTLSVTSTELTKMFTIGEITNFMSTDTDRIVNSCPSFHALWSIPLQLFITLFLLYQQVGISFLAGVAFSVILIPINKLIANKIGKLSTEMMKHKDHRVNIISDMLKGIMSIKMHVWEDYFIDKVNGARKEELTQLRGRKYLDAICVVLWASTPVLVAALTLGTHALRRQSLDAPTVFTTIALINMLISPLNAFPWVLNGLTEAWVSLKRIQKLLELPDMIPERHYDRLNMNRDEESVLALQDATFRWSRPEPRRRAPARPSKKGKGKKRQTKGSQRRESTASIEPQTQEPFELRNISLTIGREELVGITGNVGSGKSSLLHAIMGEMAKQSGDIQIPEGLNSFGYVSQKPWLLRGSVRENILFGRPYDEARFRTVVEACALTDEMKVFANKMVGEGGCTLSGGQRARIALARAVYADKQVYLLDDVLSSVDARVGNHILSRCILGLLGRRARLLVAQPAQLARASRVLLLHDGRLLKDGVPEEVFNDTDIEDFLPSESDTVADSDELPKAPEPEPSADSDDNISQGSQESEESMSHGTVDWWVIGMYLKSVGSFLTVAIILSLILMQVSQNFTFLWLTFWLKSRAANTTTVQLSDTHETATVLDHGFNGLDNMVHGLWNRTVDFIQELESGDTNENVIGLTNKTTYNLLNNTVNPGLTAPLYQMYSTDNYYLEMYFGLAGVNVLLTVLRAFLFAYGGVQAATKLHKMLLRVIVKAEISFFDATPLGRVVNRFSSDTYTADDSLPFILNILLAQFFGLLGAVAVTLYGLPWLGLVFIPLAPLYYWLQRRYRVASRQIKRLQSVARSPVYTHFSDTLEGLTTIRALGNAPRWLARGAESTARWQRSMLGGAAAAAWLALRLQGAAAALLGAAAAAALLQRSTHSADPGTVGLAISYALSMTSSVGGVLAAFTEAERELIAVERLGEYIREVKMESTAGDPPPYGWPSQGVITFEDVVLKYNSRDRPALNGVTFETFPGERLGVCGRSGAGKSSLLRALTRLAAPARGAVRVDGVDVARLQLAALRSRIAVIPQEPFIFDGSIRENLDPLGAHSDAALWRALERAGAGAGLGAGAGAARGAGGLRAGAGGLSRGAAQLLCVARALLHRAKIVLIDEATANLDATAERALLDAVRAALAGCTVVLVAHRLKGVLECDRALALSEGQVMELAPPSELLEDPGSQLYQLVHSRLE